MYKYFILVFICSGFIYPGSPGLVITKNVTAVDINASKNCFVGTWSALYLTDQVVHEPTNIDFAFFTDGRVLIKAKGVKPAQEIVYAAGNWSVNQGKFEIICTTLNYSSEVTQAYSFVIDEKGSLTNGSWKHLTEDQGVKLTGRFIEMKKQSCRENCTSDSLLLAKTNNY